MQTQRLDRAQSFDEWFLTDSEPGNWRLTLPGSSFFAAPSDADRPLAEAASTALTVAQNNIPDIFLADLSHKTPEERAQSILGEFVGGYFVKTV